MDSIRFSIGSRIRLYRRLKGITIDKLAASIHKSKSTVSKYENGEIVMDVEVLADIARSLGIEVSQLLYFSNDEKPSKKERGFDLEDRLYLYYYDGRFRRCTTSLIMHHSNAGETDALLYLDVDSVREPESCRALYYGTAERYDVLTNYTMVNQSNRLERVSICSMNAFENSPQTYGLMLGISVHPFLPAVFKCVFSKEPLRVDEALKERLVITKEDIRASRAFNMFCIEQR